MIEYNESINLRRIHRQFIFLQQFTISDFFNPMNGGKSAADFLRDKYTSIPLKKTTLEKSHPDLNELYGLDYLKSEINSKQYNSLFN